METQEKYKTKRTKLGFQSGLYLHATAKGVVAKRQYLCVEKELTKSSLSLARKKFIVLHTIITFLSLT